jgi:spore germination cell wall hydrolase CwlJ-like protein
MEKEIQRARVLFLSGTALFLLCWFILLLIGMRKPTEASLEASRWSGAMSGTIKKRVSKQLFTFSEQDVEDLARNLYHETRGLRGHNDSGWRDVAAVVFNRLEDSRFPKTIRGVIYERYKTTCAFSWFCDQLSDIPTNKKMYDDARRAAHRYLTEYQRGIWVDPTGGAHSYHATSIPPNEYFQRLKPLKVVWNDFAGHYFYGDP